MYFVPAMIGGVTIALIWDQIYYRVIPVIGKALGISWLSNSVLMSGDTALPAVVFVQIWQAVAMPTVIFIAGLLHTAADVYQQFFHTRLDNIQNKTLFDVMHGAAV